MPNYLSLLLLSSSSAYSTYYYYEFYCSYPLFYLLCFQSLALSFKLSKVFIFFYMWQNNLIFPQSLFPYFSQWHNDVTLFFPQQSLCIENVMQNNLYPVKWYSTEYDLLKYVKQKTMPCVLLAVNVWYPGKAVLNFSCYFWDYFCDVLMIFFHFLEVNW